MNIAYLTEFAVFETSGFNLDIVGTVYHLVIYMCVVQQSVNGWTCRVVRILPHTKSLRIQLEQKTLLMIDR